MRSCYAGLAWSIYDTGHVVLWADTAYVAISSRLASGSSPSPAVTCGEEGAGGYKICDFLVLFVYVCV